MRFCAIGRVGCGRSEFGNNGDWSTSSKLSTATETSRRRLEGRRLGRCRRAATRVGEAACNHDRSRQASLAGRLIPAVPVPFGPDGRLHEPASKRYAAWMVESADRRRGGLGPHRPGTPLTDADAGSVLKAWRTRAALPSCVLVAAAGAPPSREISRVTRRAGLRHGPPGGRPGGRRAARPPAGRLSRSARPRRSAHPTTILESPRPACRSSYSTCTRPPAASPTRPEVLAELLRTPRGPGHQDRHPRQRDDLPGYRPAGQSPGARQARDHRRRSLPRLTA